LTAPSNTRRGTESKPGPSPSPFLHYWLPVLAYVAVIFGLSSLHGDQVPSGFPFMDKLAHLLEYSLLGLLMGRAIRFTLGGSGPRGLMALLAISLGALVGFLDELYQTQVPGRMSDVRDWLTDVTAVTLAVVLTQVVRIGRRTPEPAESAATESSPEPNRSETR
jgi:VanZ family protein